MSVDLVELNEVDREQFVDRIGFAYEDSPWVAAAAWEARPFVDLANLRAELRHVALAAPVERQLRLIRAHPELATRAAEGGLTATSAAEQARAGLDRMPPELHARLARAQAEYRKRYGFPFVICVGEHSLESIVSEAERRLGGEPADERHTALIEITKIAALRLHAAVADTAQRERIS